MTDIDLPHSDEARRLIEVIGGYGPVIVAFSGGVDSAVIASAAYVADPERAIAVTADSASVPRWQIEIARQVAGQIGIRHRLLPTDEGEQEAYRRNDLRRCFHCKQTLYATLRSFLGSDVTIVSGTNADDLGDYRPGIEAGKLAGVRTPLADLGISKSRVRSLAREFGLSNAELPASPCLASRVAYGVEVTAERLRRIEEAEALIRGMGWSDVRVRMHADDLARIEVPPGEIDRWLEGRVREEVQSELLRLGFRFVTLDLQGLRSGSMNPEVVVLRTMGSH